MDRYGSLDQRSTSSLGDYTTQKCKLYTFKNMYNNFNIYFLIFRVYGFYSSDSSDSFRCETSQNEILYMEVVFTRHMKNIIKITEILSRIYSFSYIRSQNEILFMEVVFTWHLKNIIKTGINMICGLSMTHSHPTKITK